MFNWIADYLSNRRQLVYVNGAFSKPSDISSGVIQGSVLGPLLFCIYINDVDSTDDRLFMVKYADDIKLAIAFSKDDASQISSTSKLQNEVNNVLDWSLLNGLYLNSNKTKSMHYGNRNIKFSTAATMM